MGCCHSQKAEDPEASRGPKRRKQDSNASGRTAFAESGAASSGSDAAPKSVAPAAGQNLRDSANFWATRPVVDPGLSSARDRDSRPVASPQTTARRLLGKESLVSDDSVREAPVSVRDRVSQFETGRASQVEEAAYSGKRLKPGDKEPVDVAAAASPLPVATATAPSTSSQPSEADQGPRSPLQQNQRQEEHENSEAREQPQSSKRSRPRKGSAQRRPSDSAPPPRKPRSPTKLGSPTGHGKVKASSSRKAAAASKLDKAEAGEVWPDFVARSAARLAGAGIEDAPMAVFEAFRTSDDIGLIFATFARLFHLAVTAGGTAEPSASPEQDGSGQHAEAIKQPPWSNPEEVLSRPWRFPYEPMRVLLGGSWKAKQLWEKLDRRCARPEYAESPCATGRIGGLRAVVVGAGPCGLRAAIELQLLGARVTVVERRRTFSRLNQLHLWSWCGEDVKELGARCLEPPGQDFGANPDKLHVSISELQALLLKTALLLGVEVLLGVEFQGSEWAGGWSVRLGAPSLDATAGEPSPRPPTKLCGVAVLVGADGLGCGVGQSVGVNAIEAGSLRSEDAIGLVCNFAPLGPAAECGGRESLRSMSAEGLTAAAGERSLRSFALAKQFFTPLFQELATTTGADLENIVYTKSKLSHYFVMTPTRRCLIDTGVVRDANHKPVLEKQNIDTAALDALVRRIVAFRFKEGEATLPEVAASVGEPNLEYADRGPQLFDFSKLRRAADGLLFVDPPSVEAEEADDDEALLVALVGDALLEPFWPEGLGIVRGFFSAMDASSAVARWSGGASRIDTKQHFASAYAQLKTLGAATRASVLCPDEKRYALAPSTRYRAVVDA